MTDAMLEKYWVFGSIIVTGILLNIYIFGNQEYECLYLLNKLFN